MLKMAPESKHGKILFIDAYDSFSENIAALLCQILCVEVTMIHIDTPVEELVGKPGLSRRQAFALFVQQFDAVVLGPGPGNPGVASDVGLFSEVWKLSEHDIVPVLGICLGFQSLCIAHGGFVNRLPEPCHGHARRINHCGEDIFGDVGEVIATNYNSLEAKLGERSSFLHANDATSSSASSSSSSSTSLKSLDSDRCAPYPSFQLDRKEFKPSQISPNLRPLAWDEYGTLMSVKHVELPYWGLQFHPESCRSNVACQNIIKKWWEASKHWSNFTKAAPSIPRSLLSPGHVWSRPLTPVQTIREPCDLAENHKPTPTLYEELQILTSSSSSFVKSRILKAHVSGTRVAQFCMSLSKKDQVMLESTRKGRYSIYALPGPADWRMEYSLEMSKCTVNCTGQKRKQWKMKLLHVLDNIHGLVASRRAKEGHESLPFWGGFIGFFAYEVGLERLDVNQEPRTVSQGVPDISLLWVERSVVIDHMSDEVHVQSIRKDDSAWVSETVAMINSLTGPVDPPPPCSGKLQSLLVSAEIKLPDEATYKQRIQDCQSYLHSGDSYELCLTTEAQISLPSHPHNSWLLYCNLRNQNPVPFSAFVHLGKTTILSSSPEQFLSWNRSTGAIDMIPMKGTVAKSASMTASLAKEILASPKESAENLMIADLIRHDLYSTVGWNASVEVVKLCEVVEHETVYQLVSHIRTIPPISPVLSDDERQQEIMRYGHKALRQTLPPGSMTGAPKKRSCEILQRLEERRRGVYSGALGYLDVGGGGAFSVCIRTAVSSTDDDRDGRQSWRVGAGGAVTVLSDVDAEWREMRTKLDSVLRAFRPHGA
jgi:para-aminobenzoate synthetase